MNLKYLQIVGSTKGSVGPPYSLSGLSQLEELDLFNIEGYNITVAADVPTIRVLNIQYSKHTRVDKDGALSKTIEKLPHLHCLRLRMCQFDPDELANLVESNGSLTDIELHDPPKLLTNELLTSLIYLANYKQTYPASFELRIILNKTDVSIKFFMNTQSNYLTISLISERIERLM